MSGDFDKAIDRAVREMLDVEPPAGFRARVLRRIAGSDGEMASGFGRKILWFAAPVAAAALIALAVLLPSRSAPRPQPQATVVATPPQPVPSPAPPPVVSAPPPGKAARTAPAPRVAAAAPRRVPSAPDRVVAAVFAPGETGTEIEPLKAITPIEVAPIAEHRVTTGEISVRPLNPIVELQIAPLNPSERRN